MPHIDNYGPPETVAVGAGHGLAHAASFAWHRHLQLNRAFT